MRKFTKRYAAVCDHDITINDNDIFLATNIDFCINKSHIWIHMVDPKHSYSYQKNFPRVANKESIDGLMKTVECSQKSWNKDHFRADASGPRFRNL